MDRKADALYIKLKDGKFAKNKRLNEDTILDLDSKGGLLGIEMLNVSKRIPAKALGKVRVSCL